MSSGWHALTAAVLCVFLWNSPALADNPVEFSVTWQDGRLVVRGDLSSTGHRALLQEVIADSYAGAEVDTMLEVTTTPPGWSLVTEQALRALSATRHAVLHIDATQVTIDGERDAESNWLDIVAQLQPTLLPGMQLFDNVSVFDDSMPFNELCRQQFLAAKDGRKVLFRQSSAVLSPASLPLLDALVEVAADCPGATIAITGHTDASGDEAFNLILSEQRANAVRDYFQQRGISGERLNTAGAGSSVPLTDGNTPAARARNRRIEFDWSMPAN